MILLFCGPLSQILFFQLIDDEIRRSLQASNGPGGVLSACLRRRYYRRRRRRRSWRRAAVRNSLTTDRLWVFTHAGGAHFVDDHAGASSIPSSSPLPGVAADAPFHLVEYLVEGFLHVPDGGASDPTTYS